MPDSKYVTTMKSIDGSVIYKAPLGTTLPTDATTALAAGFKDLGFVSEDGITFHRDMSSENLREMGGKIVRNVQTENVKTISFALMEIYNPDALKAIYGDANVSGTYETGYTIKDDGYDPEEAIWVIETLDMNGGVERTVIPKGKISEIGDMVYKRDETALYDITLTCLYDSVTGSTAKIYTAPASES